MERTHGERSRGNANANRCLSPRELVTLAQSFDQKIGISRGPRPASQTDGESADQRVLHPTLLEYDGELPHRFR